ncbi:hypothetical protein FC72_GL001491 [Companilactobacillus tucceti DSM 20183]|uniref:Surface layer protein A domain-containing protein n=1 Tax=Companilactobacillus tucceti DSM 20183 TaxID=1423811 RepID=A0A0R1IW97_9LACO|nr:hypothetical protein FC72_GL001491 [Companilactobacillus tucceti DSM 20183]
MTIAGVTFFSAIILGGLNTTNVNAEITSQSTTNQVVDQGNTGATDSGKDLNAESAPTDTGSDNGANTSEQTGTNTETWSEVSGTDSGTGAASADVTTNSGLKTDNNEISGNNNISAYSSEPVATTASEVPVADSQGSTIDWNNRSEYNSSANSGIIVNYKVQGTDGEEIGDLKEQRGQAFIVGNEGDTVDLTNSLPQGYTFLDDADKQQTIGKAYDGLNAQSYIDSITKTIYVTKKVGVGQFIPALFQFKYEDTKFPITYLGYLDENKGSGSESLFPPIGFLVDRSTPPSGVLISTISYNGMFNTPLSKEVFKDTQTKMPNLVNFNLGGKTLSSITTDSIQLGNSIDITAPDGYTFSDGTTTKSIVIGAASPMYMAYYSTLGITDIDPSIHDLDIVKAPGVFSDKEVNLSVQNGVVWNPSEAFDATNSTDENGNSISFDKLTSVTIQKVGNYTPETSSTIDLSKSGSYTVTYAYNGYSSITKVNITQTPVINSTPNYTINLDSSNPWEPKDTYVYGTDENGNRLSVTDLTVTIDGVTSDVAPTTPGDYTLVYSYTYGDNQTVTSTTALHVIQNPKLEFVFHFVKIGTTLNVTDILNFTNSYDENNHLFDKGNKNITYTIDGVVYHDGEMYTANKFGRIECAVSYLNVEIKSTAIGVSQDPVINVQNKDVLVGDNITPSDLFDTSTDEFDSPLSIDKITLTIDGNEVKKDTVIDTSKPEIHTIIYNYRYFNGIDNDSMPIFSNVTKTATLTVSSNSTTEPTTPTTPSSDKEWVIDAPYLVKADDYAQIYSSPSVADPVATRRLAHDTDWMVGLAVQNGEGTFYQVSTSEWVKAEDMWAFKPIDDVVYANDPDNTQVFSTVDESKNTDINLSYQTAWLVDRVAVDNNGNTWYRVGTSNYVKASDITKTAPVTRYNGTVQLTGSGDVTLYNLDYYGNIKKAQRKASSGTTWISNNHRKFKGTTYHQISNSEWVSEIDSVFKKQN